MSLSLYTNKVQYKTKGLKIDKRKADAKGHYIQQLLSYHVLHIPLFRLPPSPKHSPSFPHILPGKTQHVNFSYKSFRGNTRKMSLAGKEYH